MHDLDRCSPLATGLHFLNAESNVSCLPNSVFLGLGIRRPRRGTNFCDMLTGVSGHAKRHGLSARRSQGPVSQHDGIIRNHLLVALRLFSLWRRGSQSWRHRTGMFQRRAVSECGRFKRARKFVSPQASYCCFSRVSLQAWRETRTRPWFSARVLSREVFELQHANRRQHQKIIFSRYPAHQNEQHDWMTFL